MKLKIMRVLLLVSACVLLAVIGYSSYRLWDIHQDNAQEAELHSYLMQYRPKMLSSVSGGLPAHEATSDSAPDSNHDIFCTPRANLSIVELQTAHLDAVGWLTIPNTRIDYPFVQGEDNTTYLHRDLEYRWSKAGTLFMDYRNSHDFSDFNTIIFGHHMRNGSMFGTLQQFNDLAFFETNKTGTLFLADKTYEINIFAFMVIPSNDVVIYNPVITKDDAATFLSHVERFARHYRDVGVMTSDRIVTLSTCNYEFDDARMVIIGRLTEIFSCHPDFSKGADE